MLLVQTAIYFPVNSIRNLYGEVQIMDRITYDVLLWYHQQKVEYIYITHI